MTIDKQKAVDSPRCGARWPQFESVCGKTKSGSTTWQCGECARKEAMAWRSEMEKYIGLYKEADNHAVHWESQSRLKGRQLKTAEQERDKLKAENEALRSLVLSALDEGKGRPGSGGNAPGHCHAVPGVWDRGNGDRSGTACGWCRIWNAAQAMTKEASHD